MQFLTESLVKTIELNNSHMSFADMQLLKQLAEDGGAGEVKPKVMTHAYGVVIIIGEPTCNDIKNQGCSPALALILDEVLNQGDIMYLAFDSMADTAEDLEVFDW